MDVVISWVVFIGLAAVVLYSIKIEHPAHSEPAHRDGKPLPRNRVARVFASFQVMDWGLFMGAVAFLISAVIGTADALF